MVSLSKKNKGFTIVELLIVIVVIGILATLVIVTFTGIQKKGRDSQRQTDINAVQSHVESFYAQHGFYPTLADLGNTTFVSTYMKGLDPDALKDPKGPSKAITTTTTKDQYGFEAKNSGGSGCTNDTKTTIGADGPEDNSCDAYVVEATLESGGKYTKQSN